MKKKLFFILGALVVVLLLVFGYLYLFTELFGKKLLPVKINNISVEYVPGNDLNFDTKYLSVVKVKLDKSDSNKIKSLIKGVRKKDIKNKDIVGKYRIIINKDSELVFNEKEAYVVRAKKKTIVKINNDLYEKVCEIVEKNNNKVYSSIGFKEFTIKKDHASINVKNKDNLKLLKGHVMYFKVEPSEEDISTFGDSIMEVLIDSNIHIIFYNNNLVSINDISKNEKVYGIIDEQLYEICESIYNSSVKKE